MELLFIILGAIFLACIGVAAYREIYSTSGQPKPSSITYSLKTKKKSRVKFTRLTMKAIIRWEQLRNKSFSLLDYTDREDVEALLYTMFSSEVKTEYTFDIFRQVSADDKFMNAMSSDLGKIMAVASQFQKKTTASDIGNTDGSSDPVMISEIIFTLITDGLDANYALNEMELCDLPMHIEAYERKKKECMEETRLWTYLTMLPHIDAKKMKNGARDLITFPWEEEEALREAHRAIKEDAERFEEFMNKGKNFIKN